MSEPSPNPTTPTTNSARRKPRASLAIATAFGLGYLPKAPGTFGSLLSVALMAAWWSPLVPYRSLDLYIAGHYFVVAQGAALTLFILLVSGVGVVVASRVATYVGNKDPQIVVIDEVSGQLISYLGIGAAVPNWKYLLLGFILFRVFDIWKPFPARQAESLPGGLGIMADDWIAGIYAALGLWIARALGL
jgi:phosphatidylglycerophosphatase A